MRFLILFFTILISLFCVYQLSNTKIIEIDKIYLINLDRSKDRLNLIENKLKNINLPIPFTRFSAFDGDEIELVNIETGEGIKGKEFATNKKLIKGYYKIICSPEWEGGFDILKLNMVEFHPRLKGEIGCACSHKKIWEEIVSNNYKNTLVLEDDIIFAPNFKNYLYRALSNVPKDYNFLYLGIYDNRESYVDIISPKILMRLKRVLDRHFYNPFFKQVRRLVGSTESYIVSQEGANILKLNTNKFWQIDRVISTLIEKEILTAYVIKPVLTRQALTSTIGEFKDNNYVTLKEEE